MKLKKWKSMYGCLSFSQIQGTSPQLNRMEPRGIFSALRSGMRSFWIFSLAMTIASFQQAYAEPHPHGGEGGGGGQTEQSTPEDVEVGIKNAGERLLNYFDNAIPTKRFPQPPNRLRDAEMQQVLETILAGIDLKKLRYQVSGYSELDEKGYPIIKKESFKPAFRIEKNGPCPAKGDTKNEDHAGSAIIGDAKTPFCLSVPMLARVPRFQLEEQIVGVMAHQLAHQAGFDEKYAQAFQRVILRRYQNTDGKDSLDFMLDWAGEFINQTRDLIAKNAPREQICGALGRAWGFIESASHMGSAVAPTHGPWSPPIVADDKFYQDLSMRISYLNASGTPANPPSLKEHDLMTYCGLPKRETQLTPDFVSAVAEGDTKDLAERLAGISKEVSAIKAQISE